MVKHSKMMDDMKLKIAVLMGGFSSEREISMRSGRKVAAALRSVGYCVEEVDVRSEQFEIPKKVDVVFIALHGTGGEDGVVQSILEKQGILFTGSGSEASHLAFDKVAAKKIFREYGLSTPRDVVWDKKQFDSAKLKNKLDYPVVVKPSRQGSSIGIQIVEREEQLKSALQEAFEKDSVVLIEEFIEGRELTVGILGEEALPVVEIRPKSGWFDYHNKYTEGATEELVPAPIGSSLKQQVQTQALKAYRILGCRDMSRVDFRVDCQGQTYLLEVNTIPGLTDTSLLPKAAAARGITFPNLCLALVKCALNRKR